MFESKEHLTANQQENIVINLNNQQAFLNLLQLMDSQFPIGSFAHSSGLETYAQMDISKEALAEFLEGQLRFGFGRLDSAACVLAYDADSQIELAALCTELTAWKAVKGIRETSLKLGKRLYTLSKRIYPDAKLHQLDEPHQAVVLGMLGDYLELDKASLLLAFTQTNVMSQLQAATRCMSLSPEQAQEILTGLQPLVSEVVTEVLLSPQDNMYSATPALDLRAHQQASLYTRLFQS